MIKTKNGRWITVNGTHVFLKDDQSVDEAMKERQIAINEAEADTKNAPHAMTAADFKLEDKKWSPIEKRDFEASIKSYSDKFGDMRDLIGNVYRRNISQTTGGEYDRDGDRGRGRAVYFSTSLRATREKINHELAHAVTEEIVSHHKEFGYPSRDAMFKEMLSSYYSSIGEKMPDWDRVYGKNSYLGRPAEIFSRSMEGFGMRASSEKTADFLKTYWKRIGR